MLKLEARFVPGSAYRGQDFRNPYRDGDLNLTGYPTITKYHKDEPFKQVSSQEFPEGTSVKDALTQLCDAGSMCGSNDPKFRAWLDDRSQDAHVGQEITSKVNPVIYRMVRRSS